MSSPRESLFRTVDRRRRRSCSAELVKPRRGAAAPPGSLDVAAHAARFVVAMRGRTMVGCADLAPLSPQVAEVRSLAVDAKTRGSGIGAMLVEELRQRARREGFEKLCAFTHRPGYFSQMGFSIVPHLWLPEKIFTDCVKCPLFRQCGQYAMLLPLDASSSEAVDRDAADAVRHV